MDAFGFSWDFLLTATVTLFVVVDPLGVMPIFASLTSRLSFSERVSMAFRGTIIAWIVLSLFGFVGEGLLATIGIGMPAFRTAGGILLFLIGLEMVFEQRTRRRSRSAEQRVAEQEIHHHQQADDGPEDISVFPLALPLLAGPGALASTLLLMGKNGGAIGSQAAVVLALTIVLGVSFLLMVLSVRLLDWAGESASIVLTRLMGMLLAALSVQYVFDGIKAAMLA